jgi:hypothetical protein
MNYSLHEGPCEVGAHGTPSVGIYIRVSTDKQVKEGDSLEEHTTVRSFQKKLSTN